MKLDLQSRPNLREPKTILGYYQSRYLMSGIQSLKCQVPKVRWIIGGGVRR